MAKVAYEFLVRWDPKTGILRGAHIKLYDNVALEEGDAQSVAVAGAAGFPLADILRQIETGALLATEEAHANRAIAEAALVAEQAAHAETHALLLKAAQKLDIIL